jgi:hypothetical protein
MIKKALILNYYSNGKKSPQQEMIRIESKDVSVEEIVMDGIILSEWEDKHTISDVEYRVFDQETQEIKVQKLSVSELEGIINTTKEERQTEILIKWPGHDEKIVFQTVPLEVYLQNHLDEIETPDEKEYHLSIEVHLPTKKIILLTSFPNYGDSETIMLAQDRCEEVKELVEQYDQTKIRLKYVLSDKQGRIVTKSEDYKPEQLFTDEEFMMMANSERGACSYLLAIQNHNYEGISERIAELIQPNMKKAIKESDKRINDLLKLQNRVSLTLVGPTGKVLSLRQ